MKPAPTTDRLAIGTPVKIQGSGQLKGLVVDYHEEDSLLQYVVAFPKGEEFIFPRKLLIISNV